ncbi:conserved protein of unknown function [Petrocella atlantisensis]|uniref:Zinc-ribbon domain-containing protein n=1 Tax=Petrocella atlantisensis TaxID=2173034 RepID=A0A3P7S2P7_9FIRM|nr:zinc ribbon domain-containing protein [Petrocella atlantisensis]VDN49106.1 conserved protein of unknown function [Petrocella atlantisensis]
MNCNECNMPIEEGNLFCKNCGSPVVTDPIVSTSNNKHQDMPDDTAVVMNGEGLMRWAYDMNMWKNPTILITVWKVMMLGAMAPALLMFFLTLEEGFIEAGAIFFEVIIIVAVILTALMLLAYPLVAIMNGGRYCVVFEMNGMGVNHIQLDKQFKKSQVLAMISVLAGVMAGNPQTTGAGLLAGTKQSTYSTFSKVKTIVVNKRRHVIYLNQNLIHNQIYSEAQDFDMICEYICQHCKAAKVTYKN